MSEKTPQPAPDLQGLLVGLVVEAHESRDVLGEGNRAYALNCVVRTPERETKYVTLWVEAESLPNIVGTIASVMATMAIGDATRVQKQQRN